MIGYEEFIFDFKVVNYRWYWKIIYIVIMVILRRWKSIFRLMVFVISFI